MALGVQFSPNFEPLYWWVYEERQFDGSLPNSSPTSCEPLWPWAWSGEVTSGVLLAITP